MRLWYFTAEEGWHRYEGPETGPDGRVSPEAARDLAGRVQARSEVLTTLLLTDELHPLDWLARQAHPPPAFD